MKKKNTLIIILITFFIIFLAGDNDNEAMDISTFPVLHGKYLGQELPGDTPELFAPQIVSTAMYTRDMAMTPDGKELFFCVSAFGYNLIFQSKEINGRWTAPKPAEFIKDYRYMYYEPHVTPDGKRLLFLSNMPQKPGAEASEDIWAVDRKNNGWSKPYNLGEPINTIHSEFFPSSTLDGTLYFTRSEKGSTANFIYRSRMINGAYSEPEKLGPEVNCGSNRYNAFIDPEERFIIIPAVGIKDSYGGTDYYIVFRDKNDHWSQPVNLGDKINTESGREYSPYISPDGNYFFFMSARTNKNMLIRNGELSFSAMLLSYQNPGNGNADIYWMKADFINELRNQMSH